MNNSKIVFTPALSQAVVFDGAHGLSLADASFNPGTGILSLDLLAKLNSTSLADSLYLAGKGQYPLSTTASWVFFAQRSTLSIGVVLIDAGNIAAAFWSNPGAISLDSYIWVGLKLDQGAKTATFLVNGAVNKIVNTSSVPGSLDNSEPLRIGADATLITPLNGSIDFIRFDKGRALPDAWYAEEWNRIKYGYRPQLSDFLALWDFETSLTDASGTRPLTTFPVTAPVYANGWPYAAGPITLLLPYTDFEKDEGFLPADDQVRSLYGTLNSYRNFNKLGRQISFEYLTLAQRIAFEAAWLSGNLLDFYKDSTYPKTFTGYMTAAPKFKEIYAGVFSAEIEVQEA